MCDCAVAVVGVSRRFSWRQKKSFVAGVCHQQSVLTPPLTDTFCSPAPPLFFFFCYFGSSVISLKHLSHPSVNQLSLRTRRRCFKLSYFPPLFSSPSPRTSLMIISPSPILFSLLPSSAVCWHALLALPLSLPPSFDFALAPLRHVTFGCSCHGDHPHFPRNAISQSLIFFPVTLPLILSHPPSPPPPPPLSLALSSFQNNSNHSSRCGRAAFDLLWPSPPFSPRSFAEWWE